MTLGQLLKDRYKVLERIGSGGMSTVYIARVMDIGEMVAVKVMIETIAADPSYRERFTRELQIARALDHPGIPRLIDDGQTEEGVPFLVLEYVQGITLTEYLRKKGPLPIEEAVAIASSVLTILSYAYSKGIQAHRDIKPGNIMIDLRTHAVTVMDFGIAKTVGSSLTHSTVLYTPRYAAPEQLLPSKFGGVVDKRADLYALGVVLYEMLTGRVPFAGETPAEISGEQITSPPPSPSSIRRDIPAPLSQVLLTCLQANPSHRYQTPQDLLQDLRAGHVGETKQTPAPGREGETGVHSVGSAATMAMGGGVRSSPPVVAHGRIRGRRSLPDEADAAELAMDVAAGMDSSFAVARDGSLWAWGGNQCGQLGDGTNERRSTPVRVGARQGWLTVSARGQFSLALAKDGLLWGWGSNVVGQLGDGTRASRSTPVRIRSNDQWGAAVSGQCHSLALARDGSLWTWGWDMVGQRGDSTRRNGSIPARVGTRTDWLAIAAGGRFCLASASDGSLWAWGENTCGQLGDGTTDNRFAPVRVGSRTDWVAIAAGWAFSLALSQDGSLWAWGYNRVWQLGDGTMTDRVTPVRMRTRSDWIGIAAGGDHSLALAADGSLWAWGDNSCGQLGDGTTTNRCTPVQVGTCTDWVAMDGGRMHSVALAADGSLWAWGDNSCGQLGDGTTTNRLTPVRVRIGG